MNNKKLDAGFEPCGARTDRIFGTGGGLLVVLDRIDEAADRVAHKRSEQIPVAFIDPRALKVLQRLGAASPLSRRTYFDAAEEAPASGVSRLQRLASGKLKAAGVLLAREMAGSALELALAGILSAAADRAGKDSLVTPQDAGVWIFSEAIPAGILDQRDANLILSGIRLAQGLTVPDNLVGDLIDDAVRFGDA